MASCLFGIERLGFRSEKPPRDQGALRLRFLGRRGSRGERPSIGVRRTRLNTAKDEKMSSRSMFGELWRAEIL